ncbi:MAG: TonB-dependent receptor [Lewinellaceae bacterium]|nr:TonB-dependent receptor [Lewinellaceae bacterium]
MTTTRNTALSMLVMVLTNLFVSESIAQTDQRGSIYLQILNEEKQALEGVSIGLMRATDSTVAKIAITDQQGIAVVDEIRHGTYFVTAFLMGYQKYESGPIEVDAARSRIDLPPFQLEKSANMLAEVTVAHKKPFIERHLDKLVLNVENSIVSAGSSILEVLERAPGVVVNQETSISLKGKQGVIVMIDGKPSPLSGADLINYLKGIPSTNIDRIEIITNPSAKYDAAGNAGIINIRFKKDQRQGLNGNLALSLGQGFYTKPSGSTNLNFRKKQWNLFGNYSYSQPKGFTRFYINRKFFNADHSLESVFDQTSFIKQPIRSHNGKFGADFYAGKKTVIGVMFNGNLFRNTRDGFTNAIITNPEGALQYTTETDNVLKDKRFNGFGNVNFKHTIDSTGKELTLDADYGHFNSRADQNFITRQFSAVGNPAPDYTLHTDQRGQLSVRSLKADYVHPLKKEAKWEAGLKSSMVETDNDIRFFNVVDGAYLPDESNSNHFIYKENINAAYVNFAKSFPKFDFQLGLRVEQTKTDGKQLTTGQQFNRNYAYLFPSVFVNRKLTEKNQLSFSYSRRIDRPDYRQLNPFRIFVDPYTYVVGDPALKPVLTNSFELGHTFDNQYSTTLSYTQSKEVITDVFVQDDSTRISYQTPANLQNFDQVSLAASMPLRIQQWMTSQINGSLYWNRYTSPFQGGNLLNSYTSWDINVSNSFTLGKKGWSAELGGYYQSKMVWGLFIIRDLAQVSAGIQKVSPNKLSTFKLSVSDVLYTNRIAVIVQYQNMDWFTDRTWDSKALTLSYTQRFGKNTVQQARRRTSGIEDEKRRAG